MNTYSIDYDILNSDDIKMSIKDIIKMLNGLCKVCGGLTVKLVSMSLHGTGFVCERWDKGGDKEEHYDDSFTYRKDDNILMFFLRRYKILKEKI